jgi:hypothetical protein
MQGVMRSDVQLFHRFHFEPRGIACRHPDGGGRTRNRYVDRRAIDWRSGRRGKLQSVLVPAVPSKR